jgi:hypothetical protein
VREHEPRVLHTVREHEPRVLHTVREHEPRVLPLFGTRTAAIVRPRPCARLRRRALNGAGAE